MLVVEWANENRISLVPYGGGSGVCGAISAGGTVVVELRAMDEILDFDEKSRLVRVQPGMLGPDLDKALRSWGYLLGHEPQSMRISTVGGWIATRAAGQLSARYGGIEDLVKGLEVVLPTGEVVRSKGTPDGRPARTSSPADRLGGCLRDRHRGHVGGEPGHRGGSIGACASST